MKNKMIKAIWMFVIGSFVGYLVETILVISQGHFEVRQGLIYGPFIPVYGIGEVMYYLALSNLNLKENNKFRSIIIVFILTTVLGGLTEYICSLLQEICFGTVSWDYSDLPFDFAGRTSLQHSISWGLLGVLYYLVLRPLIEKLDSIIDKKPTQIVTILITISMIFDIGISVAACYRQYERRKNIEATNGMAVFLDKHYPDEYLNKIYVNLRERQNKIVYNSSEDSI